jgi:hypothetical protein
MPSTTDTRSHDTRCSGQLSVTGVSFWEISSPLFADRQDTGHSRGLDQGAQGGLLELLK